MHGFSIRGGFAIPLPPQELQGFVKPCQRDATKTNPRLRQVSHQLVN